MNGIIFDMDGVLLDTHPAHLKAWRSLLSDAGKVVSDVDLHFVLDGHKRQEILRHFLGDLEQSQAAHFGALKDEYFSRHQDSVSPLPGLPEFLGQLSSAKMPIAVATSAGRPRTEALLAKFSMLDHFSTIVTGDDVTRGKPDPEIYRLAALRLGLPPGTLVVVEDAVSGIRAGKAAGMRCVGVARNGNADSLFAAGAELVIPDFKGALLSTFQQLFSSEPA